MALDMRALYYIALPVGAAREENKQTYTERVKANENCMNQNFTILAQKIAELEARLAALENT
ncbi:MAG: hypothetical protein IJB22_02345 [Clostridia bacterium]|nr:hypothetical protein [Clostridia bacterium]MBQ7112901.1 hypothetical protein [Clostridia bacterium]